MTTERRLPDPIAQADARAQDTFREALVDFFDRGRWDPILVDAYRNSEADLEWEAAKAELDAAITADWTEPELREAWGR